MIDVPKLLATETREAVERWCMSRAHSAYLGDHKAVCRVLGKYRMHVSTLDETLAPHLMLDGYWETWVTQAIARHVRPGMRCVDVGANIGYFTMLMADMVGKDGSVQAWEPQDDLCDLLIASLGLNGLTERVQVMRYAAGSGSSANSRLHVPVGMPMNATMTTRAYERLASTDPEREWESVVVQVERLDALHPGPVDFMKIDAEGNESEVWDGMIRIVGDSPRLAICMEFSPERYADAPGFLRRIQSAGFDARLIDDAGGLQPADDAVLLSAENMVWLSRR